MKGVGPCHVVDVGTTLPVPLRPSTERRCSVFDPFVPPLHRSRRLILEIHGNVVPTWGETHEHAVSVSPAGIPGPTEAEKNPSDFWIEGFFPENIPNRPQFLKKHPRYNAGVGPWTIPAQLWQLFHENMIPQMSQKIRKRYNYSTIPIKVFKL